MSRAGSVDNSNKTVEGLAPLKRSSRPFHTNNFLSLREGLCTRAKKMVILFFGHLFAKVVHNSDVTNLPSIFSSSIKTPQLVWASFHTAAPGRNTPERKYSSDWHYIQRKVSMCNASRCDKADGLFGLLSWLYWYLVGSCRSSSKQK